MGVRAKCSRCDYLRTFAEELRGTYYRCPKCRQGVIAVPVDAVSLEESAEAPRVRAARMPDNRSSEDAARALESATGEGSADAETTGEASTEGPLRGVDETPRGVLMHAHVESASSPDTKSSRDTKSSPEAGSSVDAASAPDAASSPDTSSTSGDTTSTSETDAESAPRAASGSARTGKGGTFKVQRILVECEGCGHHVAVPPAFFGKTVHCPECRADMAFSESSLEPVKDEILGRIAMEQQERRVLGHAVPPPIESPEVRKRARRRQLLVVAGLGALLALGLVLGLWKIFTWSTPPPR